MANDRQPLFNYFKQLFAQVTNPPIDSIREKIVTSTTIYVGEDGNLLEEKAENCQVIKVNNPILTNTDLMKIKSMKVDGFKVAVLPNPNLGGENQVIVLCDIVPGRAQTVSIKDCPHHIPVGKKNGPVFAPTQIPAGRGPTPTALLYITEKLTPSREMRIRCWPVRRPWRRDF